MFVCFCYFIFVFFWLGLFLLLGFVICKTKPSFPRWRKLIMRGGYYLNKVTIQDLQEQWVIPEKIQTGDSGCWGHRFFRGIKEKICGNSRGQLKKKWNFQWCPQKVRGISMRLWFLTLEFPPRSATRFCRICRGESFFSKGKVTGLFKKVCISSTLPVSRFSGIAQYSWKQAGSALHVTH